MLIFLLDTFQPTLINRNQRRRETCCWVICAVYIFSNRWPFSILFNFPHSVLLHHRLAGEKTAKNKWVFTLCAFYRFWRSLTSMRYMCQSNGCLIYDIGLLFHCFRAGLIIFFLLYTENCFSGFSVSEFSFLKRKINAIRLFKKMIV